MNIEPPPKLTGAKKESHASPLLFSSGVERYREAHGSDLKELHNWLTKVWVRLLDEDISASDTWDPGSIANGAEEAKDVTVTGAAMGDYALASFSLDVTDLQLDAQVTAADTVTCVLSNSTGGAVDLASGTIYVRVFKRTS